MPGLGAALRKLALGEPISKAEAARMELLGNNLERLEYLVRGWASAGTTEPDFDSMRSAFAKVTLLSLREGRFPKVNYNPSYVDGECTVYFYSDGAGVDELRARGKIGATSTQVTLANITP